MHSRSQAVLAALYVLFPALGSAQLYLLAGSPTPKYNVNYATKLLAVTSEGKLREIAEINDAGKGGINDGGGSDWIGTSTDWRKAVVLANSGWVSVIDFDSASVAKRCRFPHQRGDSLIDQWLLEAPSAGPLFVEFLAGNDVSKARLSGMALDPAIPCEKSFADVDPSELSSINTDGFAGVADTGSTNALRQFLVDNKGTVMAHWYPSGEVYFNYKIPEKLLDGLKKIEATILVNNHHVFAVGLRDAKDTVTDRVAVLGKSNRSWRLITEMGMERAFANFITVTESHPKGGEFKKGTGEADWSKSDRPTGPSIAQRFEDFSWSYQGLLHIYDVESDRSYTIKTNQADSEIILIDNHTVYYRVSERLYSTSIDGTTLGEPKLLATADAVRDSHWAFVRH